MARFVLSRVGQTIAVLLTAINLAKEPFSDKALRKAVTFGIDRKEILDRVEFGEGIVAHCSISPSRSCCTSTNRRSTTSTSRAFR